MASQKLPFRLCLSSLEKPQLQATAVLHQDALPLQHDAEAKHGRKKPVIRIDILQQITLEIKIDWLWGFNKFTVSPSVSVAFKMRVITSGPLAKLSMY